MAARPADHESRVRCDQDCGEYNRMDQRCMAAARGERKDVSVHYHPVADVLRCCEFFKPKHNADDQRGPRERWPHLCKLYDDTYRKKPSTRENIEKLRKAIK